MPAVVQRIFPSSASPHSYDAADFSQVLSTGPETPRQVGFTYDEMVKIMYRVKSFRLQGTANGTFVLEELLGVPTSISSYLQEELVLEIRDF